MSALNPRVAETVPRATVTTDGMCARRRPRPPVILRHATARLFTREAPTTSGVPPIAAAGRVDGRARPLECASKISVVGCRLSVVGWRW